MFATAPSFVYERQNMPDLCHNIHCVVKMLVRVLVGHGENGMYQTWTAAKDVKHRVEAEINVCACVHMCMLVYIRIIPAPTCVYVCCVGTIRFGLACCGWTGAQHTIALAAECR